MRDIFDNARLNAPSILFIDEIDALCPKRNGTTGLDRRIITTLLTLMNGVSNDANDRFIVIGTTNRPDTIDEALRLPGRFDYEIHIDIPKKEARIDILKRMLESVKHSVSESDIETLAGNAHGYVGADLASILKEAAVSFLREVHSTRKNGVNDEGSFTNSF